MIRSGDFVCLNNLVFDTKLKRLQKTSKFARSDFFGADRRWKEVFRERTDYEYGKRVESMAINRSRGLKARLSSVGNRFDSQRGQTGSVCGYPEQIGDDACDGLSSAQIHWSLRVHIMRQCKYRFNSFSLFFFQPDSLSFINWYFGIVSIQLFKWKIVRRRYETKLETLMTQKSVMIIIKAWNLVDWFAIWYYELNRYRLGWCNGIYK